MSEKIYLFNLKPVTESKPHVRRARLYREKLEPHWSADDQGREYLDVTVFENAEPDRFGNTAAAVLDTYWRDRQAGAAPAAQPPRPAAQPPSPAAQPPSPAEARGRYVPPTAPPATYSGTNDLPF